MDQPQRATAAQMASRTIKSARKPKRVVKDDIPQFHTPNTEGTLFGGGLSLASNTTTFDFTAQNPVGFGTPNFVPSTKPYNEVEGLFAPGLFPGDNRGGKRQTGWTPQSAPIDGNYVDPQDRASEPKQYLGQDRLLAETKKVPPQALGQSFQVNWPGAEDAQQGPSQALGQNFKVGWPTSTTETPSSTSSASSSFGSITQVPLPIFGQNSAVTQSTQPVSIFGLSQPLQEKPAGTSILSQSVANPSSGSATTQSFASAFTGSQGPSANDQAIPSTHNIFGHLNAPSTVSEQTQALPTSNIFGTTQPTPPNSINNIFGQSQPKPSSHNIFGQIAPSNGASEQSQASPASNMFGSILPASTTKSNGFGQSQPSPSSQNIFGNLASSNTAPEQLLVSSSSGNVLGSPMASSQQNSFTPNIFGNQKPSNPTLFNFTPNAVDGTNSFSSNISGGTYANTAGSNPFQPTQQASGFGTVQTPNFFSQSNAAPFTINPQAPTTSSQTTSNQQSSNIFNTLTTASSASTNQPAILSNTSSGQNTPNPFNTLNTVQSNSNAEQPDLHVHNTSSSQQSSNPFTHATSFNSIQPAKPNINGSSDQQSSNAPILSNEASSGISLNPPTTTSNMLASQQNISRDHDSPDVDFLPGLTDEDIAARMPAGLSEDEQSKLGAAMRLHILNQSLAQIYSQMPVSFDFSSVITCYQGQKRKVISTITKNLKNIKAKQIFDPKTQEKAVLSSATTLANSMLSTPLPTTPRAGSIFNSQPPHLPTTTPAWFTPSASQSPRKHALDNEDQENEHPAKRIETLSDSALRKNNGQESASTPTPSHGKRRAEDELTQNTVQVSALKQNLKGSSQSGLVTGQSSTSNILRGIVDTSRKISPIKSTIVNNVTPSQPINPFGSILASPSNGNIEPKSSSATATGNIAPGKLSTPKSISTFVPPSTLSPKPTSTTAPPSSFVLKSTSTSSTSGSDHIKPPVFATSGIDFAAQFKQKAAADAKDNEAKLMEKAKLDDMDSDEDEQQWELNWKAKRGEELKKLKESSQGQNLKFVAGKGFVYDQSDASDSSDSSTNTTSKSAVQKPNSLFNSPNPSRPSSPGLGNSIGSVTDDSGSAQQNHNIFGSLSNGGKIDLASNSGSDKERRPSRGSEMSRDDSDEHSPELEINEESENDPGRQMGAVSGPSLAKKTNVFDSSSNNLNPSEHKENSTPSRNLFDRIDKDANGNPIRSSQEEKENTRPTTSTGFGGANNPFASSLNSAGSQTQPTGSTVFGEVKNPFGKASNNSNPTDHTWKPNSPIKFGSANTAAVSPPTLSVTAATPPKSGDSIFGTQTKSLFTGFGNSNTTNSSDVSSTLSSSNLFGSQKPPTPFTGFGNSNTTTSSDVSGTPASSSLFGNQKPQTLFTGFGNSNTTTSSDISNTPAPSSLFGSTGSTSKPSTTGSGLFALGGSSLAPGSTGFTFGGSGSATGSTGFAFGGSGSTSLLPSAAGSANTSRGTSPAGTSDNDESVDPQVTEKHEQIDLSGGGPGEENEDVVFEVRAKLLKFDSKDNKWPVQGIGPFRILKHKETGVTRIVMRGDSIGKVLLNKSILSGVTYAANGKTMKLTTASDDGKSLETYMVQVKEPEMANQLAESLNANK